MLNIFWWAALSVAGLFFAVTGLYVLAMHAKVLKETGRLNLFWTVVLLPWAVLGLLLDALFNLALGWIIFGESPVPEELLFSSRVQRHVRESGGWRLTVATFWRRQLNAVEPGHIRP